MGITADIKNISDSTVYITSKYCTLTMAPELESESSTGRWAQFPTGWKGDEDFYDAVAGLAPGDSYKIFWDIRQPASQDTSKFYKFWKGLHLEILPGMYSTITSELSYIFFSPGDYKASVVINYWTNAKKVSHDEYRTIAETATVNVASPQSVILFGAAIGGLFAYFLLPHARKKLIEVSGSSSGTKGRAAAEIGGVAGAMLLSSMVTILLARMSESQFLIRVTVADFWGAIAVGFVANYFASSIFRRVLEGGGPSAAAAGGQGAGAGAAAGQGAG